MKIQAVFSFYNDVGKSYHPEKCLLNLFHLQLSILGDPGIDGRIIKMDLQEVDWIDLAQDMDRYRPLVNVVMNILVP
jgi:hypothetical protein